MHMRAAQRRKNVELFLATLKPDLSADKINELKYRSGIIRALNDAKSTPPPGIEFIDYIDILSIITLQSFSLLARREAWMKDFHILFSDITLPSGKAFETGLVAVAEKTYNDEAEAEINKLFDDFQESYKKAILFHKALVFDFDRNLPDLDFLNAMLQRNKAQFKKSMQENNDKLGKKTFTIIMEEFFTELFIKAYQIHRSMSVDKLNAEKINAANDAMPQDSITSSLVFGEDTNQALFNLHIRYKNIHQDHLKSYKFICENLDLILPRVSAAEFPGIYQDIFNMINPDFTLYYLMDMYAAWEKDKDKDKKKSFSRFRLDLGIQIANRHRAAAQQPYTIEEIARQKEEFSTIDFAQIINLAFSVITTMSSQLPQQAATSVPSQTIATLPSASFIPSRTIAAQSDDEESDVDNTYVDSSDDDEDEEDIAVSDAKEDIKADHIKIELHEKFDGLSTDYDYHKQPNHRAIAILTFNRELAQADSIEEIDALYDISKAYINRHRNPNIDKWFSIETTNSWKTAATQARMKALKKYLELTNQDANAANSSYVKFRDKGLFAEKLDTRWFHRFFGQQHSTQAQIVLDECHSKTHNFKL